MTESEIQKILYEFVREKRHKLVVDNCKALNVKGEADLISVTSSNFIHEFEIKTSVLDYKREFKTKKRKHKLLEGEGNYDYSANYFWFVVPEGIIEEVPDYTGLIQIKNDSYDVVKKAPRRHSSSMTDRVRNYLERGITIRYWESKN